MPGVGRIIHFGITKTSALLLRCQPLRQRLNLRRREDAVLRRRIGRHRPLTYLNPVLDLLRRQFAPDVLQVRPDTPLQVRAVTSVAPLLIQAYRLWIFHLITLQYGL